jgi:hypothetical protein
MPAASTTREALRNSTGLTAAISTRGRLCAKKAATVTGNRRGALAMAIHNRSGFSPVSPARARLLRSWTRLGAGTVANRRQVS